MKSAKGSNCANTGPNTNNTSSVKRAQAMTANWWKLP